MTGNIPRNPDRVEEYIEAVDRYEPRQLQNHADEFRLFARYISRSLDARYLERHPTEELLPELEHLMTCALSRQENEIKVNISVNDDGTNRRGVITVCIHDRRFLISTVRQTLDASEVRTFRSISCVMPVECATFGGAATCSRS